MAKSFHMLRVLMAENDYNQTQLARKLGMHHMSLSDRMCGKTPFKLDEMYQIMDLFGVEHDKLHEVFPHPAKNVRGRAVA